MACRSLYSNKKLFAQLMKKLLSFQRTNTHILKILSLLSSMAKPYQITTQSLLEKMFFPATMSKITFIKQLKLRTMHLNNQLAKNHLLLDPLIPILNKLVNILVRCKLLLDQQLLDPYYGYLAKYGREYMIRLLLMRKV